VAATHGQLAGATLAARYEVLDLIGAGGMGEVYRGRDRELDEIVALKVIRGELLALPDALARFRTEVKLARRVTHRNVARAYEFVTSEGVAFYTMELISGMPLSRRLLPGRPLELSEAASIVHAVCEALAAAHAVGIVHRDVKPANILLAEDGRTVLTDFGIAAAVLDRISDDLAGTPRYMAPEQSAGSEPTPAADVFALGVVLYEMVTGRPAFAGGSVAEVAAAKQRLDHLVADGVPPRLADLIARATMRDRPARLQSARELGRLIAPFARGEIRDVAADASLHRPAALPSVVVLAAPGDGPAHLVEGFHQMVVDRLVQWPRLRVAARHGGDHPGAGVIELAVRGGELALTAAARAQSLAFRRPFDAEDLPRLAEQAARTIATFMGSDAAPPPARGRPVPPAALELILRARHEVRRNRQRLRGAIALCERALELAPGHPRVEATLATCQAQLAFYAPRLEAGLLDDAAAHALAALAADPDLAEAHFARAHVELHRGRPLIAAVCFRAAIARAPLMAEAHEWLGRLLLEAGFAVDARARLDDAFALGPIAALDWFLVLSRALEGRWDEVDAMIARLRTTSVDGGRVPRLRIASWRGRPAEVAAVLAELAAMPPDAVFERPLIMALFDPSRPWAAKRDEILAAVDDRTRPSARRSAFLAQLAAEAAGAARDIDTCIALLLRCSADGLFDLPWFDRCPALDAVRAEPRFAVIRTDVAARAEAVHDALFGEHKDQATIATVPASMDYGRG
jgi:eukaryotic-like serine/threonine-protein kinase